ncbi:hypothetical protein GCM10023188_25840 [Pontibacter saemangeumensis]|uniref:Sialidase domain-containing protein n=1 Tax=Pontibacter saemangeumensis TaxID=1084525 RepID=A0ABP8LT31_9BACT
MSLARFFMALPKGGASVTTPPGTSFDDTKTLVLTEEYVQSGRYLFTGSYTQNPVSKNVLHSFFNGSRHVFEAGKKVSGRRFIYNGATSALFDIYTPPAGWGVQDVAHGHSANGRCHLFFDEHEGFVANVGHRLMYTYSNDDGVSWSTPADVGMPPNGHKSIRVIGNVVESNGVLLKPYYSGLDEGSYGTESARYVLRSTNGGATWAHILVEQTAEYVNEGSVMALGNTWLYAVRRETGTRGWRFYKSTDAGLTWAVQGDTQFGEPTMTESHPPHLAKFKINGVDIFACYFVNRNTKEYKVIYGKAADVIAGISGWNLNTKLTLFDHDSYNAGGAPTFISGYGCFYHIDDTLEAKGISYLEYSQTTATHVLYFNLPTTHYGNLKTQLGITAV